jgi:ribosomal protein L29
MKFEEIKNKNIPEIKKDLQSLVRSLIIKRSAAKSGVAVKGHEIRNIKKDIARLNTALTTLFSKKKI